MRKKSTLGLFVTTCTLLVPFAMAREYVPHDGHAASFGTRGLNMLEHSVDPVENAQETIAEANECFPIERTKTTVFDAEAFSFWPLPLGVSAGDGLVISVVPSEMLVGHTSCTVSSHELPLAISTIIGRIPESVTFIPDVVGGIPVVSVFSENHESSEAGPVAVVFPVVGGDGSAAVCVVHKVDGGYTTAIVMVNHDPVWGPASSTFDVPDIGPVSQVSHIGRFTRYGAFSYPSRLWKLRTMGLDAENRGDEKTADVIYEEFVKVFDNFIINLDALDEEK